MTEEERAAMQERMAVMQARTQALDQETEAAIAKILDAKQRARLAQIHLQRQGIQAFATPELAKKLNIGEEKFAEIQQTLAEMGEARRGVFGKMGETMAKFAGNPNGGRPDRAQMQALFQDPKFQAEMAKTRKQMDTATTSLETQTKAKIGRSLTKKQRDAYTKMLGEPFDLTKLTRGTGGPGGNATGTPKAAPAPVPVPAPNPAAPARKSLRERRGGAPA